MIIYLNVDEETLGVSISFISKAMPFPIQVKLELETHPEIRLFERCLCGGDREIIVTRKNRRRKLYLSKYGDSYNVLSERRYRMKKYERICSLSFRAERLKDGCRTHNGTRPW